MLRPAMRSFWVLFAFVLLTAGCKAGEGDSCKEEDDCSGMLMCCKASLSATARGTCRDSCEEPVDSGPMPDVPMTDSMVDDAGDDAGEEDAGDVDAGEDAGEADAGDDAGDTDAGPDDAGEDAATDAPADAPADVPADTFDAG